MEKELERALERPTCPSCAVARIRPTDITGGRYLEFECAGHCGWTTQVRLPDVRRIVIYLDSYVIGKMASAQQRAEKESPWRELRRALRNAAASGMVSCPASPLVRTEAHLSPFETDLTDLTEELCDPGLRHSVSVQDAQILRALDAFLGGAPPALDTKPPTEDAFRGPLHVWHPVIKLTVRTGQVPGTAGVTRNAKSQWASDSAQRFQVYRTRGSNYEEIRKEELLWIGQGFIEMGATALTLRSRLPTIPDEETRSCAMATNTYDLVLASILRRQPSGLVDAVQRANAFFRSPTFFVAPFADMASKLHAALALNCRDRIKRLEGDFMDIQHIATYLPYVDLMIVDRFFASLCRRTEPPLDKTYAAEVTRLSPKNIPAFIRRIEEFSSQSPHARLSHLIHRAIVEGGHHRDQARAIKHYMEARGWNQKGE